MAELVNKLVTVYLLRDPRDGQVRYVGITRGRLSRRLAQHRYTSDNPHKRNWFRLLDRLGLKAIIEEIERVPESISGDVERKWIAHYIGLGIRLLNGTSGGERGNSPSPEVRRRIIENTKKWWCENRSDYVMPESHRAAISRALKGRRLNPNPSHFIELNEQRRGIPLSPEHRGKMSQARKGRKLSPETRAKLSAIRKQKWQDPVYREFMREVSSRGGVVTQNRRLKAA